MKRMKEQYPVLEGAEPFSFQGNKTGVLVQHGFTGTTQSMIGLGKAFAEEGYTVYGPRLAGHGTHYEDMERTTYEDWMVSAEEGYRHLTKTCDKVFVAGLSMGGTIALNLAADHPEIKGIMLINAATDMPDLNEGIREGVPRFLEAIGSDIKKEGVTELAYEKTPVASIKTFVTFMEETRKKIPKIKCPTLIFTSVEDHVVPPENSKYIYDHISSTDKQIVSLENSYHVATLDNDAKKITDDCIGFLKRLSGE